MGSVSEVYNVNLTVALGYLSAGCALAAAAACIWRIRRSLGDWTLASGLALVAVERLLATLTHQAATFGEIEFWQDIRFFAQSTQAATWLLFSLTFVRGELSTSLRRPGWRPAVAASFFLPVILAVIGPEIFSVQPSRQSGWVLQLPWSGLAFQLTTLLVSIVAITELERTFRAAIGTIRWRIKFILLAAGLLLATWIYASTQSLLYKAVLPDTDVIHSISALIACVMVLCYVSRIDSRRIDVYPSAAFLRGSITILVAGIYLVIIGALGGLVTLLGGDAAFPIKAFLLLLSLAGLAALLQSDRARLRIRQFVSQHLKRPVHDYREVWQRFSEATSTCVEPDELCASAVKQTADVFDALSVSLWLVNDRGTNFRLAASTSLAADGREAPGTPAEIAEVLQHFRVQVQPQNIDAARGPWAATVQRWHATEFPNGGPRLCAPLVRQTEFVGLLIVGDRIRGTPFGMQDLEMLKCISGHIASSLLNITLSHKLVQARELEAFQTMATFFVHDLKNAASTLTLILKNLPSHFNNPEFREDTLRSVSGIADHINDLIHRLGMLRRELRLARTDQNLNEIVRDVLQQLGSETVNAVEQSMGAVPPVSVDREQITRVVTNLTLNALDATAQTGHVRISTAPAGDWVVLTVTDTGMGMTPEFVRQSLFRPFQSTKKNGLGIGMFQTKTIIEAHGGRISVASEPDKGTTFNVYLPTYGRPFAPHPTHR